MEPNSNSKDCGKFRRKAIIYSLVRDCIGRNVIAWGKSSSQGAKRGSELGEMACVEGLERRVEGSTGLVAVARRIGFSDPFSH
jgi:hypothetical protein